MNESQPGADTMTMKRSCEPVRSIASILAATLMVLATAGCGSGFREMAGNSLEVGGADPAARSNLNANQQAEIYFTLGRNAEGQGNLQEAIRMYQSVLAKVPDSGEAHWRLGICMDKSGNFDKSEHHYTQAIKSLPGNPHIFSDYGYSLSLQSRWRDAEMQLRQAIALKPDLQRAHNNLGIVIAQGSNPAEAVREFQLGGSNVTDAHWNVAQTLIAQSRWGEAKGEFQRILAMNPADQRVQAELQGIDRMVAKLESLKRTADPVTTDNQLMRASATQPAPAR